MSTRVCGSCGAANGDKYRCAGCKSFKYCSVPCYKKHQESTCTAAKPNTDKPTAADGAATASTAPTTTSTAAPAPAAASAASSASPSIPKSNQPTVAQTDLDALARDPQILAALSSQELQNILRRIDNGGVLPAVGAAVPASASDEERSASLDKFRAGNPDFEKFIQQVLEIINKEDR